MTASIAHEEHTAPEREFAMNDDDFQFIVRLIARRAGIALGEVKRNLVYSRLARRLRVLQLDSFSAYCQVLADDEDGELEHFVNALTTNLTSFFREPKHFEYLEHTLLPAWRKGPEAETLRIWSAGCSTGEEPYSLAMTVDAALPEHPDVRILATDLDSSVIARARTGIYDIERVQSLATPALKKWFQRGTGERSHQVRVRPGIRERVTFRQLNLMEPWPMRKPFDIIFCRNVVIYFDRDTQRRLFDRFAQQLKPGGHLFVGHSETLHKVSDRFRLLGNTIHQRVK
ncbi:MAG: CheR family methyltransferase [Pseudomonadota bacterium]